MEKAGYENNWHYNAALLPLARKLRKNMTKGEACLWKYVLKSSSTGYKFRKQRPTLNYIVDFVCLKLLLIIEVDGSSHSFSEVQKKDELRQKTLEAAGFTILRFTEKEALTQIEDVRRKVHYAIEVLE